MSWSLPGALIAQRYRIRTAMVSARVFLCRDERLGRDVVLKTQADVAALRSEFDVLSRLRHPNIVSALGLVGGRGREFLVMSVAPGRDFLAWSERRSGSALAGAVAAIARALRYLHRRDLVHRDLKPSHVRIAEGQIGRLPAVRLLDFGLCRPLPALGRSGTPAYVAPEVLGGDVAAAPADLFAVGVMLSQALGAARHALSLPRSPDSGAASPGADRQMRSLQEIARDLTVDDPGQRPTADELLEALSAVTGTSFELDREELLGDFFPVPDLVGSRHALLRIEAALRAICSPLAVAPASAGCRALVRGSGKTRLLEEVRRSAQVLGLHSIQIEVAAALSEASRDGDDAGVRAARAWAAVRRLLSTTRGRLLTIDDVRLDCPFQRAFWQQLSLARLPARTVVVAALADSSPDLPADAAGWDLLTLPLLEPEHVEQMVRSMFPQAGELRWLDWVQSHGDGDPRRVVALVRHQSDIGFSVDPPPPSGELISAARRVEQLPPAQRRALSVVGLANRPLPPLLLEFVDPSVTAELGPLLARGLIRWGGAGLVAANAEISRAARRLLSAAETAQLHRQLAEAWNAHAPARRAAIGHHLFAAGDDVGAAEALVEAPQADPSVLAALLDRVPHSSPCWPALVERVARCRRASGDLESALALAERLRERDELRGSVLAAELQLDAGRPAEALDELRRLGSRRSAAAERARAKALILVGDFGAAAVAAEHGLAELSSSEPGPRVELLNSLGLSLCYLGRLSEAQHWLTQALELGSSIDDDGSVAKVANSLAITMQRAGRPQEARRYYARAAECFERCGELRLAATARLNLGTLAHQQLLLTAARGAYRAVHAVGRQVDLGTTAGWALANEANLCLLFGEFVEAARLLERAEVMASRTGALPLAGYVALLRAESAAAEGQSALAEAELDRARRLLGAADEQGAYGVELLAAELAVLRADRAQAAELISRLRRHARREQTHAWRTQLVIARYQLADTSDRAAESAVAAIALLEATLAEHGDDQPCERTWELHFLAAEAHLRVDDAGRAANAAARAIQAIASLRSRLPAEVRASFDQRPDIASALQTCERLVGHRGGEELHRVLAINHQLNQGLPLRQLLDRVLDAAISLAGAERGFVLMLRDRAGRVTEQPRVAASRNIDGDSVRRSAAQFSRSLAALAIEQQRTIALANEDSVNEFGSQRSVARLKIRAVLCVPLRVCGVVEGAIYLDNRFRGRPHSEGLIRLIEAFADQAGIALANARLLERAEEQQAALARAKAEVEALNAKLTQRVHEQRTEPRRGADLEPQDEALVRRYSTFKLLGQSEPMRRLFGQIERLAAVDAPVLIWGESGTGKELVARAVHGASRRSRFPFVAVNCAAIPASLLESELFGSARGAFTGADQDRRGVFELAADGVLFLDEIGDMDLAMQAKLLRVLEQRTFRRLGDGLERVARCRVVSATHRRLDELVQAGRFREDLFYRLNVVRLELPPLRERREDIPLLIAHFVRLHGGEQRAMPSAAAIGALTEYSWPGNVRQLENELRRALVLGDGPIEWDDLSREIRREVERLDPLPLAEAMRRHERRLILTALRDSDHNITVAAERLGIHRVLLHRKLRLLGIRRAAESLGPAEARQPAGDAETMPEGKAGHRR